AHGELGLESLPIGAHLVQSVGALAKDAAHLRLLVFGLVARLARLVVPSAASGEASAGDEDFPPWNHVGLLSAMVYFSGHVHFAHVHPCGKESVCRASGHFRVPYDVYGLMIASE